MRRSSLRIVNLSCADRHCSSSSDNFVLLGCLFLSGYWRIPDWGRAFVYGHTLLHSWSGPIKLIVCLLHCATLMSNLTSAPFVPAKGLRAQRNSLSHHARSLSTADLARTTSKLPHHHASLSASAKSRDVFGTGDFTAI